MQNGLKHLYEGIYCLNKGLKVKFVYYNQWDLTYLDVFSSEWNPDDKKIKTLSSLGGWCRDQLLI